MFPYPFDAGVLGQPAELDRAARLGEVKKLVEQLPCEKYWGTPGPKHCRRCDALARLDEEIKQA
jgi:hypothetical protein